VSALERVVAFAIRRSKLIVCAAAVLLFAGIAYAVAVPISTSRYRFVSGGHDAARLMELRERFGQRDPLVVVLSGGDEAARRRAVDALGQRLAQLAPLEGRVLGRIGLDQVAEVSLLIAPGALTELRRDLGDAALVQVIEGGVPAWVRAIRQRLERVDRAGPVEESRAQEGLLRLAKTLRAIDTELAGGDAMRELPRLADQTDQPVPVTIDEKGYLVDSAGARHYIVLFADVGDEGRDAQPLALAIREARDQIDLGGVRAQVTGLPALAADELVSVRSGLARGIAAALLSLALMLYLAFRSVRYSAIALLLPIAAMATTLIVARAIVGSVDAVSSLAPMLVLGPSVALAIHFISSYGAARARQYSRDEALREALVESWPAQWLTTTASVMALVGLLAVSAASITRLVALAVAGWAVGLVAALLLLPASVWLVGRWRDVGPPILRTRRIGRWASIAMFALAMILPYASSIVATSSSRIPGFALSAGTESGVGLARLDPRLGLASRLLTAQSIEEARGMAAALRDRGIEIESPSDVLPALDERRTRMLREGFAGLVEPSFARLRERTREPGELMRELGALVDELDEVGAAMRAAGMPMRQLDEAKSAARLLRDRVAGHGDDAALARAEMHLADLLERAWRTARRVADRGHYTAEDLPRVFRAPFVARDGHAVLLYAVDGQTSTDPWPATGVTMLLARELARLEARAPFPPIIAGSLLAVLIALAARKRARRGLAAFALLSATLVVAALLAPASPLILAALPVALGMVARSLLTVRHAGSSAAALAMLLSPSALCVSGLDGMRVVGVALVAGALVALVPALRAHPGNEKV
jgi:hypothetical protein